MSPTKPDDIPNDHPTQKQLSRKKVDDNIARTIAQGGNDISNASSHKKAEKQMLVNNPRHDGVGNDFAMPALKSCSPGYLDLQIDCLEYWIHVTLNEKNQATLSQLKRDILNAFEYLSSLADICVVTDDPQPDSVTLRASPTTQNYMITDQTLLRWKFARLCCRLEMISFYFDVMDVGIYETSSTRWSKLEKHLQSVYQFVADELNLNKSKQPFCEHDYHNIRQSIQIIGTLAKLKEDLYPLLSENHDNTCVRYIVRAFNRYTQSIKQIFSSNSHASRMTDSLTQKIQTASNEPCHYTMHDREDDSAYLRIPDELMSFLLTNEGDKRCTWHEKASNHHHKNSIEEVIKHVDHTLLGKSSLSQSPSVLQDSQEAIYSIACLQDMVQNVLLRWCSSLFDTPKLVLLGINDGPTRLRCNQSSDTAVLPNRENNCIVNLGEETQKASHANTRTSDDVNDIGLKQPPGERKLARIIVNSSQQTLSGSDTEDPDDVSPARTSKTSETSNIRGSLKTNISIKSRSSETSRIRSESDDFPNDKLPKKRGNTSDEIMSFDSDANEEKTPRMTSILRRRRLKELMSAPQSGGKNHESNSTISLQSKKIAVVTDETVDSVSGKKRAFIDVVAPSLINRKNSLPDLERIAQDGNEPHTEDDESLQCDSDFDDDDSYQGKKEFRHRVPFTEEEVAAIVEGIEKHGKGNWSIIQKGDRRLRNRTKIQIKDKYRTMLRRHQI